MARPPIQSNRPSLTLPNYEVIEVIGKGGMATVYKAVQKSLNRVVAIKELKESLQGEGTPIKRFEREAMTASAMSHENIVSIYEFFKIQSSRYLVMEYVGGTDLATVMARCRSLPVDIATIIVLQVVRALEYIHANNLVHRDIKPGNIMITHNGVVKLMDFGVVLTPDWETLTMPGTFVGTPRYMSPEQIKGAVVDFRSDLFSTGIIFYELVTGKQLFDAPDKTQIFYSITRAPVRHPGRIRAGLPGVIGRSIRRCLKKEARKRYSTTHEMRRTLEGFLGNQNLLVMRQRLVTYLRDNQLIPIQSSEEPITSERVLSIKKVGDFFLEWLVGRERFGFVRGMLTASFVALTAAILVWWQNPTIMTPGSNPRLGGLKVMATPWANVYVDGRFRQITPYEQPIALIEGYHKITLKHPEYGSRDYELPVRRGEVATLAIDFRGFGDKESSR